MKLDVTLRFDRPGYIAHPYWPEMFRLIEIQKQSGYNRARSEKKRREALESHLRSLDMTLADYEQLEALARRPFHMNGDGSIIIPRLSVAAMLANANDVAPSKLRIDALRSAVRPSDLTTGKTEPDGVWERFVVVKSGSGRQLSNQRGFRSNPYIEDFEAKGTIEHDATMVRPEAILELLRYAGRVVGIGASRKMGWGRFEVVK